MQQQSMDDEQLANQALRRVVECGPEIITEPGMEEAERRMVLAQAVDTPARNRLDPTRVAGCDSMV